MTQYIDKDALVAEIEKLLDKGKYHEEYDCAYRDGNNGALYALKGKLNTLEAKEVDLDEEIANQYESNYEDYLTYEEFADIAKHFYELGLIKHRKQNNMDYYKSIMWKEIERLNKSYNDVLDEINSIKVPHDNIGTK